MWISCLEVVPACVRGGTRWFQPRRYNQFNTLPMSIRASRPVSVLSAGAHPRPQAQGTGGMGAMGQAEPPHCQPWPRLMLPLLHPGDLVFREIITLGNSDLVSTCLFAFNFIFSLTKYGYFLPSVGMERNEEQI